MTRLKTILHGRTRSLEARILIITCFYGALCSYSFFISDYLLGLSAAAYLPLLGLGITLSVCYYLTRFQLWFQRNHRVLASVVMVLLLGIMVYLWRFNGGTYGGTHYFFFVLVVLMMIFYRGWVALLIMLCMVGIVWSLMYIEYLDPSWTAVYDQNTPRLKRFLDVGLSIAGSMLLLALTIHSIKSSFDRIFKQLTRSSREFSEDLTLARNLQKQIYDYDPELTAGFDFSVRYIPSGELSGDLFDLSRPDVDRLRIFMADARGHGINAALSAMLIKSEWSNLNRAYHSPAKSINLLNKGIIDRYGDTLSFTCVLADISSEGIVYCSAGHVPQYLSLGNDIHELSSSGPPVGMVQNQNYTEMQFGFEATSRLLLFTDALTEETTMPARMQNDWMSEMLIETNRGAAHLLDRILNRFALRLGQNAQNLHLQDDLMMIVVGRPN